ncbi:MAG: hypothetical protein KKB51_17540 [Candidatus Riflebacteria bacterium]|nr:hypothetical protein [Candidatus Riflebacteria bacterium]
MKTIESDFTESDYKLVVAEMESINLNHVMANSQSNLDTTWSSILQLSKGDLNKLRNFVAAAKKDFRDVIYWATLENQK